MCAVFSHPVFSIVKQPASRSAKVRCLPNSESKRMKSSKRALAVIGLSLLVFAPTALLGQGRYPLPGGATPPTNNSRPSRTNELPPPRPAPPPPSASSNQNAQIPPGARSNEVTGIEIRGNKNIQTSKVRSYIATRVGRVFDPEVVQADVRALAQSGYFLENVRVFTEPLNDGVNVIYQVNERPRMETIEFVGNNYVYPATLLKKSGLKKGEALDMFRVREGARNIEEYYQSQGYGRVQVEIVQGLKPGDTGVKYLISEGPMQRIARVNFVGNEITTGARLKTQIESKPSILWIPLLGGNVDFQKIDQDVDALTVYYRNLGFFNARISRDYQFDSSGRWMDLTFIIDEGKRYKIRNVSLVGNQKFKSSTLAKELQLKQGQFYDRETLDKDVNVLTDIYGAQGHIYVNVQAEPRFLEEPGELDLVYKIEEGAQYRVGRINVKIEGDYPHTRQSVVRNRISLRPGDIIDIRQIRASERRLKSSQLFLVEPQNGISPTIKVEPLSELQAREALARVNKEKGRTVGSPDPADANRPTFRGQSPDEEIVYVELVVDPPPFRRDWKRFLPFRPIE